MSLVRVSILSRRFKSFLSRPVTDLPVQHEQTSWTTTYKGLWRGKDEEYVPTRRMEEYSDLMMGGKHLTMPLPHKLNLYAIVFVIILFRWMHKEASMDGGYLEDTWVADIVPNTRSLKQKKQYKKIKAIVYEIIQFEKDEMRYYERNPHLLPYRETHYYNIPEDPNKMFSIERVRIPLLGDAGDAEQTVDFRLPK